MGKKRRLDRFIRKWIKSDLPDDRSPKVLLLGVTRIPTSPAPARRPCSLPLCPSSPSVPQQNRPPQDSAQARRNSFVNRRNLIRRNSSKKRVVERPLSGTSEDEDNKAGGATGGCVHPPTESNDCNTSETCSGSSVTPSLCVPNDPLLSGPVMDRSVDSIGACSLDVEASADMSGSWSEATSVETLRSASILSPSPEPHLPSYLSLACTVNGYCTTTNYDPGRLAKSRDASPHRSNESDHLTPRVYPTYSIQNNLLSPPNLVPLPIRTKPTNSTMSAEHTLTQLTQHHHQEFYSSSKSITIMKESHFSSNVYSKDSVDACIENGHHNIKNKTISYESKNNSFTTTNGQSKYSSETAVWKDESESKSFIKQRIERLYGPGALAQVVFPIKRQKSRTSESENDKKPVNKTSDELSQKKEESSDSNIKQSTSSPTLPVLRHLRPEFRAQLPIISPRKSTESSMQKSCTVPTLKDEVKMNGHSKLQEAPPAVPVPEIKPALIKAVTEDLSEKNGHYFLNILETEAKRLLELADKTEAELEREDLSEEVIGKIRSASGKARLLVSQKMQQFKGLCTNNITQVEGEAFPTTNEDLQGFWDMVMLQVDQVNALFAEIDTLRANHWVEVKPPTTAVDGKSNMNGSSNKPKKVVARPRPTSAANEEARKQREAQRKQMIEERRKAMKAQNKPKESIEIFVPESS